MDGGVTEPLVGVVLWLASLDSSADRSVLKLAFDRLRSCLRFMKEGAMVSVAALGVAMFQRFPPTFTTNGDRHAKNERV